jgi:GNAT superfamily N-acetyltransferase
MMIRAYEPGDTAVLTAVHNTLYPDNRYTPAGWQKYMEAIEEGGRTWVATSNQTPIGYAAVLPVPALPGLVEMEGFIVPARQRQGWGTRLLQHICQEVAGTGITQLSHAVPSLDTPAAHFLLKNHFFIEHEEWTMELNPIHNSQFTIHHSQLAFKSYPHQTAVPLFLQLYTASFTGLPWDQPFTAAEVASLLTDSNDLKFLLEGDTPVGFMWVRRQDNRTAQFEPAGIIQEKQGLGYGRFLFQSVLQQLAQEGVTAVSLGVWANHPAGIHLYQSLGFQHTSTTTYLALNV